MRDEELSIVKTYFATVRARLYETRSEHKPV